MAKNTIANKRIHIYYTGSVQGIGFRYTAERVALSLGLTGWAKNLPDGRVEVLCEGKEADIEIFLRKIDDTFKGYVRDIDVEWSKATGEFSGFDIRF